MQVQATAYWAPKHGYLAYASVIQSAPAATREGIRALAQQGAIRETTLPPQTRSRWPPGFFDQ